MLDFKKMAAFVSLADTLNYQQAASTAGVTVATLQENLALLEQDLAIALFSTQGTTIQLTAAGQAILPQAKQIIASWQQLQANVANCRQQAAQEVVHLAVLPSFTNYDAADIITTLGKQQKLTVNEEKEPYQTLLNEQCDVALTYDLGDMDTDQVEILLVATDRLAVYVPARNHLADKKELTLPDLQAEKFLTLNHQTAMAEFIQQACDAADLFVYSVFEGERGKTLVNMVALGMGVTLLMEDSLGDDFDSAKVVKIPITPAVTSQLVLARLKDKPRTPQQDEFWARLQQVFN